MLPDIDSLVLFAKAAELRNLTRAAQDCFITVPAASRRLSLLEHQFNAKLFERHSRGLQLTPAGEHLLKHAREVIAMVNLMRAEMSNYAHGRNSVLRVVGNTSALAQFLPSDIASFQADNDTVRVLLEESWSEEVARKVRAGEADLGVVVEGAQVDGLWCQPYRSDRLAAVVRTDDSLTGEAIAFEQLLGRDLVGLEAGSTLTRLLTSQAALHSRPLALRVQVRSFEAVCRAVQAQLGIGILPMVAAIGFTQSIELRVIPLSDAWALRPMKLCMRARPGLQTPLGMLSTHLTSLAALATVKTAKAEQQPRRRKTE